MLATDKERLSLGVTEHFIPSQFVSFNGGGLFCGVFSSVDLMVDVGGVGGLYLKLL